MIDGRREAGGLDRTANPDVIAIRRIPLPLLPQAVLPRSGPRSPTARPPLLPSAGRSPWTTTHPNPIEAVGQAIDGLSGRGRDLGAVEVLLDDDARAAAGQAQRRIAGGTARPLEGLPFGIKDNVQATGSATTFGSRRYRDHRPTMTAAVVSNLRSAGAILTAKLATYEFASGPNVRTANPWSRARRSGGSSSGPSAVVGGGLLPLAIGTDAGGSIRVPAAWCGAVGLKPTLGLVPTIGIPPLSWTMDHVGPITTSALDAAWTLYAMVHGDNAPDLPESTTPEPDPAKPLRGLRIGALGGWFALAETEVRTQYENAVAEIESLGAVVAETLIPEIERINPDAVKRIVVAAESAAAHQLTANELDGFGEEFSEILGRGLDLHAVDYLHALRLREVLAEAVDEALSAFDLLISPTSAIVAPLSRTQTVQLDGREWALPDLVARNTSVFNLSGSPAITVPCGLGLVTRMPVGLQLVAPAWRDDLCLRAAIAYQQHTDHHLVRPDQG